MDSGNGRGQTSETSLIQRDVTDGNSVDANSPITKGDSVSQIKSDETLTSSSASSSEELFQVHTSKFSPRSCVSFSLKPNEDSQPISDGDTTHKPVMPSMSPTQTPPVQTMNRSEGNDHSRIPSSVFESKPTTPLDWSVASNDSLFSLNVGSYSFSREQFLSGDLSKSADFDNQCKETGKNGEGYGKSCEFIMFSPPTPLQYPVPPPEKTETDQKSFDIVRNLGASESGVADDATKKPAEEQNQNKAHSNSPRFSGNGNCSNRSFAFPILTDPTKGDVENQKTPQQPLQQPPQQQQQQEEAPNPTEAPKSSTNKWFSCFNRFNCCRSRRSS